MADDVKCRFVLDDVLLDIEPVALSTDGLTVLERIADQAEAGWYWRRRREALAAAGLLGAGYNPMQPRGRDGKWVNSMSWVRWLKNGKWQRGQVKGWSPKDGSVLIKSDEGENLVMSRQEVADRLYTLTSPKATLALPDPKNSQSADGFTQVGPQGGSNPGGLYQVTDPALVKSDQKITPQMVRTALSFEGESSALKPLDITNEGIAPPDSSGNAVILDNSTGRVYSRLGGTYWDLGNNEPVPAAQIFGVLNSPRRAEVVGQMEIVKETDGFGFGDLARLISNVRSMVTPKPPKDAQYYVKTSKSIEHAKNEALANYLYELGGVPVPDVSIGSDDITFASRIVEGDNVAELSTVLGNQSVYDQLRENFVFDAWLANWDVVGLNYDNVKVVDGVPYRIDAGGAMLFRAMGSPKGQMFGNDVGELETLRFQNPQSGTIFADITDEQAKRGAERLAAITPQDIVNAVEAYGLDKSLSDKLIARRKFVLDKYGVDEPEVDAASMPSAPPPLAPEPEQLLPITSPSLSPEPTPKVFPPDISGMHWNPALGNFVDGPAPTISAQTQYFNWLNQNITANHSAWSLEGQHAAGQTIYTVRNGELWRTEIAPGANPGLLQFNFIHPVTGEQWSTPVTNSESVLARALDPVAAELFAEQYRDVYRPYETYVTNAYTDLKELFNDGFVAGTGVETSSSSFSENFKPNDWVIDGSMINPSVYKVVATDLDNSVFTVRDLDGNETILSPTWTVRHGAPGSMFDRTLDAIEARNIVAKTSDTNDSVANTAVENSNVPTESDTEMQNLSATTLDIPSEAPLPPLPGPPEPEPEYFDPETQINKNLNVIGEVYDTKSLDMDTVGPLLGKKVYYRVTGTNPESRGVFTLESAKWYSPHYPTSGIVLNLRDSTGRLFAKRSSYSAEIFEIEGNIAPILQYTEKQSNDIVVNGEVVGTWAKDTNYYWSDRWRARINGKYTVSGKDFAVGPVGRKKEIKQAIVPMLMPPGSGGSKPKTAKAKQLEKQLVFQQIAFGGGAKQTTESGKAVTLLDGAEVKLGMWTISKTDGKIGKIVATEVSPEAGVAGSVKVDYGDGNIKIRGASTLSAAISPEGELPPGSPLYAKVTLGDGSTPFPSQEVMSGTTPVVIMAIKPDGNVRVLAPDGTKKWMKAFKLTKGKDYSKEVIVEVDVDPGGAVSMAGESWKTAPKATKIPYAAPGGAVISQASNAIEEYRKYAQTRKLTKDNFVPMVGMRVRDSSGTQFVVVKQAKSFDSNPSTVWVIDPLVGGKPKARQPSRLWVDHSAELATWDGKPLPKVAKVHLSTSSGEQTFPNGSTLYSYSEITYTYGGNRKKTIRYVIVKPDGTALSFNGNGQSSDIQDWKLQDILSNGVGKVAYFDNSSNSTMTVDSPDGFDVSAIWFHDSAPGALEDLKVQVGEDKAAEAGPSAVPQPGELQSDVVPDVFGGDDGTLVDLPKPTNAPDSGNKPTVGPPPPPIQSEATRLAGPSSIPGSFTIGSGIEELKKRITTGDPGSRSLYSVGDSDYIEDMAIRLQSAVDKNGDELIEVRFRLLEDKVDDLGERLITNNGQVKVGGWVKSPLKGPKEMAPGDAISVRRSATVPEPDGGALKPADTTNPNATVVGIPVLVGTTKAGYEAYRLNIMTAGGAAGTIILEQRPTPTLQTYEWDPTKVIDASYFDSHLSHDAASMGWSIRNDGGIGYETTSGVGEPDALGRKIINPTGNTVRSTGAHQGTMRLKYDGGEGSYMTVQVTHPDSENREPYISAMGGGVPTKSKAIRQSVNGEVLIRVPKDDPHALDKISAMMSAAGVPPTVQGQPTGRDLRKAALNKVFKQFNLTYTHQQRPDVTGDDDSSSAAVLKLIDDQISTQLGRPVTMDDIHMRVIDDGRMEFVLSDDVAHALNEKSNFRYAYHGLTRGYDHHIWTSKTVTGLLSTDERWSAGVLVDGGSSESDVTHDAGNRIFFRFATGADLRGDIVLSPTAVNKKLDNYWSPSDFWGRRQPENTAKQYLTATSFGMGNEVKIKRKIDMEMMAFVLVNDYDRQEKINKIKASGLTHINGRPVEEIFVTKEMVNANDLGDLGAHYGKEIPITSIPLEGTVPPTVEAPVVVAP